MPDEVTLAELARRLDRMERFLQELSLRLVSTDVYARDQRETDRRFGDLEKDLADEKTARQAALADERTARQSDLADEKAARLADIAEVKSRMDKQGTNWRQALYSGILPTLLFAVTLLLQLKAGK